MSLLALRETRPLRLSPERTALLVRRQQVAIPIYGEAAAPDGFRYFRDWLISEGRGTYEQALADPDSLAAFPVREYFDLEMFGAAAYKVFERKGGGEPERDFSVELAAPAGQP